MKPRTICEVCGKPEAGAADRACHVEGLCWAPLFGGEHAPDEIRAVLREARAERDRLRALLAAYGRAVEETGILMTALTRGSRAVLHPAVSAIHNEAAKWREWG